MRYLQLIRFDERHITAFVAIAMSLVIATSVPVKAVSVQQGLIGATETLKSNIDATLDATIAGLRQNEKDMAALKTRLAAAQSQFNQAVIDTRDQINTYIQQATALRDKAAQLVKQGAAALSQDLQDGVTKLSQELQAGSAAAAKQLQAAVKDVQEFVNQGKVIVAAANQLVQEGQKRLDDLKKNAEKFTQDQVANATQFIETQIDNANTIAQKVGEQVTKGEALISQAVQTAGAAAAQQLQTAASTIQGFIDAGRTAVDNAGAQIKANVDALQTKVQNDLQAIKNAVKVDASTSGVKVSVDLGNGIVAYGGITIPPEVAAKLQDNSQKMTALLTSLRKEIHDATDPAVVKAKVQDAVKQINQAALAGVYATTTKAVNSQVDVANSLQVSANALQVQINQLIQCIKESSTSEQCKALKTSQNSGDQGASLQEKITKIRTNIDTVRSFLSASVNLVTLLKNGNYHGTVESLNAMTTMMYAISTLSGDLRNDLKNLSNAVNV